MNEKEPIIVSLGVGARYPKLMGRLRESCLRFEIGHVLWREYPPGARTHRDSPYGFKVYVIRHALEKGFTTIVWADSAAYLVQDPNSFFQLVKEKGIVILGDDVTPDPPLRKWVNDKSLRLFELKRNDVKECCLVCGTIFGFDFTHRIARDFFNELLIYEKDGWFKEDCQKPKNEFLQHRHDEAIMSLMVMKYDIKLLNAYSYINGGHSDVFRAGKDI